MTKTLEALGVVMTLGFSKLFLTVLETEVFFFPFGPGIVRKWCEKKSPRPKKRLVILRRGSTRKYIRVFLGTLLWGLFSEQNKTEFTESQKTMKES